MSQTLRRVCSSFRRADFQTAIDDREFLQIQIAKLSPAVQRTLTAWMRGDTAAQIARAEQVTPDAIRRRLKQGLDQLIALANA